jgi:hypothetical protein
MDKAAWAGRLILLAAGALLCVLGTNTLILIDRTSGLDYVEFSRGASLEETISQLASIVVAPLFCFGNLQLFWLSLVLILITTLVFVVTLARPSVKGFTMACFWITGVFLNPIIQIMLEDAGVLHYCGY